MMLPRSERLSKQLKLFDVYVIATGAMFSSGFFLLPGIAAAETGASVILAYFLSALLIVPAMLSQAELATAMPRAGGAYYFLDRTLGPLVGTIGGIGTWFALALKSAFALIGMGYYLQLLFDAPFKAIAVAFAIVFGILNVLGARESSRLVRWMVLGLLAVLTLFLLEGSVTSSLMGTSEVRRRLTPFVPFGIDGLLGTVGMVFVSYIGLTKVASLAEEVRHPDRNIPLGMTLSLMTVTCIYVLGVFIMVVVLGVDRLSQSVTPAADTADTIFTWLPGRMGMYMVVFAAVAAFASMSNTGILAASRYPLAMGRDRLVPTDLATLGRFRTPVYSILLTTGAVIAFLLVLDVAQVAKLASALQLTLFGLINVAVIVMRESRIESYDPGFRSPLYPWTQFAGIVFPMLLVAEMGWLPALFTVGVVMASVAWYNYYARGQATREGAIYHWFERLGRRRFAGLDRELRDIMKEKGARAADPFDEVVAHAFAIDFRNAVTLDRIVHDASDMLERRLPASSAELYEGFTRGIRAGVAPVSRGAALFHLRFPDMKASELVLVRCRLPVQVGSAAGEMARQAAEAPIHALFFLVSGEGDAGRHLRILAQLAGRIEDDNFMQEWLEDRDEQELKETLLRDDRFMSLELAPGARTEVLIGHALNELRLPEGTLVALIRRYGEILVPGGRTVLREGDRLTVIGSPSALRELQAQFGDHPHKK
jgi:amino acid transporter/mannitol/fructose-specific phosphotransferase system IIA component (Ntr-type)